MKINISAVGNGVLTGLTVPMIVLNSVGSIISGVWLLFLGEWWALIQGIIFILLSSFTVSILLLPNIGIAALATLFYKRGEQFLGMFFLSASLLYTLLLITFWSTWILNMFIVEATPSSLIPLLIWSYGVALAPWSWLASKDQGEGGNEFSVMTTFSTQLAYIIAIIAIIAGTSIVATVPIFLLILLINFIAQLYIVISNKKVV